MTHLLNNRYFIVFLLVSFCVLNTNCVDDTSGPVADSSPHIIVDNKPAANWELAYPVGNGHLGAMAFGDYPRERILLNEETIWAKVNPQGMPEDSAKSIADIANLIQQQKYTEAIASASLRQ